jgi:hypothetical protein
MGDRENKTSRGWWFRGEGEKNSTSLKSCGLIIKQIGRPQGTRREGRDWGEVPRGHLRRSVSLPFSILRDWYCTLWQNLRLMTARTICRGVRRRGRHDRRSSTAPSTSASCPTLGASQTRTSTHPQRLVWSLHRATRPLESVCRSVSTLWRTSRWPDVRRSSLAGVMTAALVLKEIEGAVSRHAQWNN